MHLKSAPRFCVGIDLSDRTFVATIDAATISAPRSFEQSESGFEAFHQWLRGHKAHPRSTVIAMETTGVLGERLCQFLLAHRYRATVIDAARIASQRRLSQPKTDRTDSVAIAAYLRRFYDTVTLWQPREAIVEELRAMLSTREQLVRAATALANHATSVGKGAHPQKELIALVRQQVAELRSKITRIELQIRERIAQHPVFEQCRKLLSTIPGVKLLLATNMLITMASVTEPLNPRTLANYLGICPHERSSGTSVYKRPRSSRLGPPRMRKLLYLAARSLVQHQERFRTYYRDRAEKNKSKKLLLNNVANKLLRIMCAVLRSQKPYQERFISVKPA
jgi:transposase